MPQHPPVFTLGKRGTDEDVLTGPEQMRQLGADVHRSARGGQATFHGPGQAMTLFYPSCTLVRWLTCAELWVGLFGLPWPQASHCQCAQPGARCCRWCCTPL